MKWILAIIAFYVWSQSRATGLSFADQASRDIQKLLGQINQVNPPEPVLPINPLRLVITGGSEGGGAAPTGGFSRTFTKPFKTFQQPLPL